MGLYQGFTTPPSRSRDRKWIQNLSKPYKYPQVKKEKKEGG
jgi:hypothetical protein